MPRKLTVICGLMLAFMSAPILGQENGHLTVELEPAKGRNGAPVTLFWTFHWDGTNLLEGYLEMDLVTAEEKLGTFRTHDMVLVTGEQSFTIMLPPIMYDEFGDTTVPDLHVRFVTKKRTIDLNEWPVAIPSSQERKFVMCICDPTNESHSEDDYKFINSLDFTKFDPAVIDGKINQLASTAPVYVAPSDMPAGIMSYCSFDLVILTEKGFAEIGEKRLQVIGNWVEAGGRLCLLPGSRGLKPFHATFLNRLVSKRKDESPFVLDSNGKLVYEQPLPGPAWMVQKGLGRVGIVTELRTGQVLKSPEWHHFVAFLWNVRTKHMSYIRANGTWNPTRLNEDHGYGDALSPSVARIKSVSGLVDGLMPDDVEVVPLPLIGLLLFLYILAIGPVDYFLLGFFKQRKLTWIVFPVVTIGFTLFTVWLSHFYMAAEDNRKAITIFDLGDDGNIVRTNRFELLFNSQHKTIENKLSRELFTAMNHRRFGGGYESLAGAARYEGRIPTQYVAVQEIPQWTPQLNRRFSLTVTKPRVKFDWDGARNLNWDELNRRVVDSFGREATCYIYRSQPIQVSGPSKLFIRKASRPEDAIAVDSPTAVITDSNETTGLRFLHDICVRPQSAGLFKVISRISPTGGTNFEDLTILDPSNPNEWLLVVIDRHGDEVDVYRKLFTGGIE